MGRKIEMKPSMKKNAKINVCILHFEKLKRMILLFQIILFAFGTPTQPVDWPTDIFKQKYYSYHGLATGKIFSTSLWRHQVHRLRQSRMNKLKFR